MVWGPGRGWTWWSAVAGHASLSACHSQEDTESNVANMKTYVWKVIFFLYIYLSCKLRENEWCFVNFWVVIFMVHIFHFFFWECSHRFLEICFLIKKKANLSHLMDITNQGDTSWHVIVLQNSGGWQMENEKHAYRIFTAEHESNLATGIRWDGCVGIVHHRE